MSPFLVANQYTAQTSHLLVNGSLIPMFSSFKQAGEVIIRRAPALESGAGVDLNASSQII